MYKKQSCVFCNPALNQSQILIAVACSILLVKQGNWYYDITFHRFPFPSPTKNDTTMKTFLYAAFVCSHWKKISRVMTAPQCDFSSNNNTVASESSVPWQ